MAETADPSRRAGYSHRSLQDKLGLRPGQRAHLCGAPADYARTLGPLPEGLAFARQLRGTFDFVHCFTQSRADLERRFPALKRALRTDGMLWVSWPKKASGVTTDVTEDVVRRTALAHGLVDVKVAAVDAVWSGLKLVYRKKDR